MPQPSASRPRLRSPLAFGRGRGLDPEAPPGAPREEFRGLARSRRPRLPRRPSARRRHRRLASSLVSARSRGNDGAWPSASGDGVDAGLSPTRACVRSRAPLRAGAATSARWPVALVFVAMRSWKTARVRAVRDLDPPDKSFAHPARHRCSRLCRRTPQLCRMVIIECSALQSLTRSDPGHPEDSAGTSPRRDSAGHALASARRFSVSATRSTRTDHALDRPGARSGCGRRTCPIRMRNMKKCVTSSRGTTSVGRKNAAPSWPAASPDVPAW